MTNHGNEKTSVENPCIFWMMQKPRHPSLVCTCVHQRPIATCRSNMRKEQLHKVSLQIEMPPNRLSSTATHGLKIAENLFVNFSFQAAAEMIQFKHSWTVETHHSETDTRLYGKRSLQIGSGRHCAVCCFCYVHPFMHYQVVTSKAINQINSTKNVTSWSPTIKWWDWLTMCQTFQANVPRDWSAQTTTSNHGMQKIACISRGKKAASGQPQHT